MTAIAGQATSLSGTFVNDVFRFRIDYTDIPGYYELRTAMVTGTTPGSTMHGDCTQLSGGSGTFSFDAVLGSDTGGGGGTTAPAIASFTASPASIPAGQSTTLSWTVSNAASLSIAGIGVVTGSSVSITPTATTAYTLTASGPGGTATRIATVEVQPLVGASLTAPSEFRLTVQQGSVATGNVAVTNPGTTTRYATLSVFNLHPDLGVAIVPTNPIPILPGETKSIDVRLDATLAAAGTYDDLLLSVSAEDGTTLDSNLRVTVEPLGSPAQPELIIRSNDISLLSSVPGTSATLAANVRNVGNSAATNVEAAFYDFGTLLGTVSLGSLPAQSTSTAVITAPITTVGNHLITVVVTHGSSSSTVWRRRTGWATPPWARSRRFGCPPAPKSKPRASSLSGRFPRSARASS